MRSANLRQRLSLRNGVIPSGSKGMTAQESACCENTALNQAVARNRLVSVVRTTRLVPTKRPKKGRNEQLIDSDQSPGQPRNDSLDACHAKIRDSSRSIVASESLGAPRRAMITKSSPGSSSRRSRNHSRKRRFTRFRSTAFPTFLLTVRPTRAPHSISVGKLSPRRTTKWRLVERWPLRWSLRKSRR